MHEKAPVLQASDRERIGTRYCKRYRDAGQLPAVLYGHGQAPIPILLESRDTLAHIHKGEKVFRMNFAGAKGGKHKDDGQTVLLKDLQFDYLGSTIVHADFARVDLSERVRTRVPIHLVGEAKGLKQAGAILMHPTAELEIECMVSELPDFIEVDIADLDVGHSIAAAAVKLPSDSMKLITDSHAICAQIVIQLEVEVAEATTATGEAAEPEVITAKKPAEGEEGAKDAKAGAKDAKPAGDKKK
ncbi:MAG: 50S ribosomal protein L25 [Phycisphaerales bacterium]|nr:50S ribosomal protein L25 [Phycisphaerales bacterium]